MKDDNHQAFVSMGTSKCVKAQATLLPGPGSLCFQLHGPLAAPLRQRRRKWHPTPVLLPGKSHGRRSLIGSSPWGRWESDTTERLHFHFSLSCTGEGNGNPLQCSCLENPKYGGAWWAAVYGVTQSRTRLKQLSSSSSQKFKVVRGFYFRRVV